MFIHRGLENTIKEATKYFPVITLTGPRQSGKTTLIKNLFPNLNYYSLENIDTKLFAKTDPRGFLLNHEEGCIIDEVHNVPELLSYLQEIVDENPKKRFILSGSSNFALLRKVTQSLAGRSGVFELLPMSMSEVREITQKKSLDELIYSGLYPAVCTEANIPKFIYPSYIKTYLERDVRDTLNVQNMLQFNIFLKLCAGRIGSIFNASELANEVGIAVNTINSWLSVLVSSYVVFLLQPYYENTTKRLIKRPKLYFCDTGLACSLLNIESPLQLSTDKMRGHLFENLIVTEFLKRRLHSAKENNIFFYRDSNHNEIDIVEYNREGLSAVEIKSSATYSSDFEKVLQKASSLIKAPVIERKIIYAGSQEHNGEIKLLNYKNF